MVSTTKLFNTDYSLKVGNHSSVKTAQREEYIYFNTAICVIDHELRHVIIDNGGYCTSSTTRAINDYIKLTRNKYANYNIIDRRD